MMQRATNGFAVALAWPESFCKTAGAWYDILPRMLGILKNGYYQVGHAALILIDPATGHCSYYDFGRYHAPYGHGRVRSAKSDPELAVLTRAMFSEDGEMVLNYQDILQEVHNNKACHGDGKLYASISKVNYTRAHSKADKMQRLSPIKYGPFLLKATNCSRFVNTVLLAGNPGWMERFKLIFVRPLTPTTMTNVNALNKKVVLGSVRIPTHNFIHKKPGKEFMRTTLPAPNLPKHIAADAQWISGEGAGSWFVLSTLPKGLWVSRYSPDGELEHEGWFNHENYHGINLPGMEA
jgi:hypothetical protein